QVEFWARLGRAIEPLLQGAQALALSRSAAARPLSECIREIGTEAGRRRLADYLATEPFPHYEAAPGSRRGLLVRVDADGTRTLGRFVKRRFVAVQQRSRRKKPAR